MDKYSVNHFITNDDFDEPGENYGILEIEEMHEGVKQAITDLKEAHADGGVSTADPEAIADKWRERVQGLLTICHGLTLGEVNMCVEREKHGDA